MHVFSKMFLRVAMHHNDILVTGKFFLWRPFDMLRGQCYTAIADVRDS